VSVLPIANTDRRTTERLTSDSLGDVSLIQIATLQLYGRNVPLLHTSRYVIPRDSVLPGLPPVSTASDNAGSRRPGDEVRGCVVDVMSVNK